MHCRHSRLSLSLSLSLSLLQLFKLVFSSYKVYYFCACRMYQYVVERLIYMYRVAQKVNCKLLSVSSRQILTDFQFFTGTF